MCSSYLEKEKEKIIESFNRISNIIEEKEKRIETEKQDYLKLQDKLVYMLKLKIGDNIYWASPAWNKYETHTISDVRIEKMDSSFFGKEYVGKECVKIFVNDGKSYYIADNIGDTLFFTEKDAYEHTATYRREKGETL